MTRRERRSPRRPRSAPPPMARCPRPLPMPSPWPTTSQPSAPKVADGVEGRPRRPGRTLGGRSRAVAGGTRLVPAVAAPAPIAVRRHRRRSASRWSSGKPSRRCWDPMSTAPTSSPSTTTTAISDLSLHRARPTCCPRPRSHTKTFFRTVNSTLKNHVYRDQRVTLHHNPELRLFSRIGETRGRVPGPMRRGGRGPRRCRGRRAEGEPDQEGGPARGRHRQGPRIGYESSSPTPATASATRSSREPST